MVIKEPSGVSRAEGSITIFLSLTLVLILSFLFSLLEAARVKGMQELAEQKLILELESTFGGYNSELWNRYRLLFLDGSFGTGELDIAQLEGRIMEESCAYQPGTGFYRMYLKDIEVSGYTLATDEGGSAFFQQAVMAGQKAGVLALSKKMKEKITQGRELEDKSGQLSDLWDNAKNAKQKAEEQNQQKDSVKSTEIKKTGGKLPENPMNFVELLKKSSILSLVAEDPGKLSRKSITLEGSVENRKLYCGNMKQETGGLVDKLWLLQYLNTYFHSEQDEEAKDRALDYEMEYCIGGKETDMDNLEQVVKKILLLREAGNFITIMQDTKKLSLAMEVAVAAVGFTGIVPLIEAVKYGILLAWSYVESIMDLRCLLAGGKVALIKKTSEWRSDLFHLTETLETNKMQENQEGMEYREYLMVLLGLVPEKKLICRTMDVIEKNIQLHAGYEKFRMDTMIAGIKAEALYTGKGLFLNLFPKTQNWDNTYYFKTEQVITCQE